MEEFNIDEKIEMFDAEPYTEYVRLVQEHDGPLVIQNGILHVSNRKLKPPVLKNVFEYIDELVKQKGQLMMKYHELYVKLIHADNPKVFKAQYENLLNDLNVVDINIERVHRYYELVNKKFTDKIANLHAKQSMLLQQHEVISQKAAEKQYVSKNVKELVEIYKKQHSYAEKIKELESGTVCIDFFIERLPVIDVKTSNVKLPKKEKVVPQQKEKPSKKQVVVTKVTPKQINAIKDNIKELITQKFKFKNKEECTTRKTSQPYYMSKDNIVEEIEKTPEIKKLMPAKYKTLPKEKICDYLFF